MKIKGHSCYYKIYILYRHFFFSSSSTGTMWIPLLPQVNCKQCEIWSKITTFTIYLGLEWPRLKGIVHAKLKILPLCTQNLFRFISSAVNLKNMCNHRVDGTHWFPLYFSILWKSMETIRCLVTHILLTIFQVWKALECLL